jgi:hypothetical protein
MTSQNNSSPKDRIVVTRNEILIILLISVLAGIIIVFGIPFSECMANHPCTGVTSCDFWSGLP